MGAVKNYIERFICIAKSYVLLYKTKMSKIDIYTHTYKVYVFHIYTHIHKVDYFKLW